MSKSLNRTKYEQEFSRLPPRMKVRLLNLAGKPGKQAAIREVSTEKAEQNLIQISCISSYDEVGIKRITIITLDRYRLRVDLLDLRLANIDPPTCTHCSNKQNIYKPSHPHIKYTIK